MEFHNKTREFYNQYYVELQLNCKYTSAQMHTLVLLWNSTYGIGGHKIGILHQSQTNFWTIGTWIVESF